MARVQNQRICDNIDQMQDKLYAEIFRVIKELDGRIRESEQITMELNPEETYEVTISNMEMSYIDENGQKWANITNGSRPTKDKANSVVAIEVTNNKATIIGIPNIKECQGSTGPECTRCGQDHEKGKCLAEGNAFHRCG